MAKGQEWTAISRHCHDGGGGATRDPPLSPSDSRTAQRTGGEGEVGAAPRRSRGGTGAARRAD